MNKKFIKAYFRYGSALLFVNRVDEALKIVEQGLKVLFSFLFENFLLN